MKPEAAKKIPKIIAYGSNGFDELIKRFRTCTSKSFPVLFFDPSGACKTTAAAIIAAELNLNIYRADISSALTEKINETEKKLDRIFNEASCMNAILFFEDADELFGESVNISNGHDRCSKMETRYLLQKIEEYNGIVILAIHHVRNMDEAFIRKMRFVVEFPYNRRKHNK